MDEKHLILEQYRIYNEMKESFINRSFMINRFFMIFSAVFLFSLIFAKCNALAVFSAAWS